MSDELRISIEKLVYGGDGLAHADGNTVFVPYVLPGEEVRAATKSKRKKLVWAQLLEVTSASAQREGARCPHFQTCGGCHYQHIPAAEQLRLKKEILRETLSRLCGIQWMGAIQEHSAEPYGYRNRAQWAVRNANPRAIGYFLPAENPYGFMTYPYTVSSFQPLKLNCSNSLMWRLPSSGSFTCVSCFAAPPFAGTTWRSSGAPRPARA